MVATLAPWPPPPWASLIIPIFCIRSLLSFIYSFYFILSHVHFGIEYTLVENYVQKNQYSQNWLHFFDQPWYVDAKQQRIFVLFFILQLQF